MATLPVMNLLSVTVLLEAHHGWGVGKKRAFPKMPITQPIPLLIRHQLDGSQTESRGVNYEADQDLIYSP